MTWRHSGGRAGDAFGGVGPVLVGAVGRVEVRRGASAVPLGDTGPEAPTAARPADEAGDVEAARGGRKPRPRRDETPLGRVEAHAPGLFWLGVPRELLGGGDAAALVELEELREYLLDRETLPAVRDRVWRWLVAKVRTEGGDWYTAAVFLAMPALRSRAWALAPIPAACFDDVFDAHGALICELLTALHRLDVGRGYVAARAVAQAYYHARGGRAEVPPPVGDVDELWSAMIEPGTTFPPAWGNPDTVLERLVRDTATAKEARRIDRTDAELIGRTYLEVAEHGGARTGEEIAAELGFAGEAGVRMARDRAIGRLAVLLDARDRYGTRLIGADARTPSRAVLWPTPAEPPPASPDQTGSEQSSSDG